MIFSWQAKQWRQLLDQYHQERLPHALLLLGPAGLGKFTFAQELAQYLLCQQPGDSMCGHCGECRLIMAGNHPDLLKIVPEEKASNIKIEQIRQLIFTFNQTAQRGGYQIAIIAPAQKLNQAAANALLKIIEEPMGKILFLLVSDQWGALPATIISRCQQIKFTGTTESEGWLAEQLHNLNKEVDARLLLKITEGAPLKALSLAQNNYLMLRDQVLNCLISPTLNLVSQEAHLWLEAFISLVADILRIRMGVSAEFLVNHDKLSQLRQLTESRSREALWAMFQKLNEARRLLANSQIHLNETLLMESLLIHWELHSFR